MQLRFAGFLLLLGKRRNRQDGVSVFAAQKLLSQINRWIAKHPDAPDLYTDQKNHWHGQHNTLSVANCGTPLPKYKEALSCLAEASVSFVDPFTAAIAQKPAAHVVS